jgi:hypothetical protein
LIVEERLPAAAPEKDAEAASFDLCTLADEGRCGCGGGGGEEEGEKAAGAAAAAEEEGLYCCCGALLATAALPLEVAAEVGRDCWPEEERAGLEGTDEKKPACQSSACHSPLPASVIPVSAEAKVEQLEGVGDQSSLEHLLEEIVLVPPVPVVPVVPEPPGKGEPPPDSKLALPLLAELKPLPLRPLPPPFWSYLFFSL